MARPPDSQIPTYDAQDFIDLGLTEHKLACIDEAAEERWEDLQRWAGLADPLCCNVWKCKYRKPFTSEYLLRKHKMAKHQAEELRRAEEIKKIA